MIASLTSGVLKVLACGSHAVAWQAIASSMPAHHAAGQRATNGFPQSSSLKCLWKRLDTFRASSAVRSCSKNPSRRPR
jgi:hypothetical protein